MGEKRLCLEMVEGVQGPALYLENYRIAGPKPWGGGKTVRSWKVRRQDIDEALRHLTPASVARPLRER